MTIFRFVNRDMVGASHDVVCPISQAKPNFNIDLVSKKTMYIVYRVSQKIFCVKCTGAFNRLRDCESFISLNKY